MSLNCNQEYNEKYNNSVSSNTELTFEIGFNPGTSTRRAVSVSVEEISIIVAVLLLWVGAIGLFINRWIKFTLMEPYNPYFPKPDEEAIINPLSCASKGGGGGCDEYIENQRPSITIQSEKAPRSSKPQTNSKKSCLFPGPITLELPRSDYYRRYSLQSRYGRNSINSLAMAASLASDRRRSCFLLDYYPSLSGGPLRSPLTKRHSAASMVVGGCSVPINSSQRSSSLHPYYRTCTTSTNRLLPTLRYTRASADSLRNNSILSCPDWIQPRKTSSPIDRKSEVVLVNPTSLPPPPPPSLIDNSHFFVKEWINQIPTVKINTHSFITSDV